MLNKSIRQKSKSKSIMVPKILAPAGDFISLKAALDAGADEIFFGVRGFNMRAGAGNFELTDLKKISSICKQYNAKSYLALNIIVYNSEIPEVSKIIKAVKSAKIDAVIAWDMSVINECIKQKVDVHLSTQASVSNFSGVEFYKRMIPNLTRVVLARECSLEDVKSIAKEIEKKKLGVEIEAFVHGAMCVSISGRCFMSQEVFGKSANRGECLQPCRRLYSVSNSPEKKSAKRNGCGGNCSCNSVDSAILTDLEEDFQYELGKDYVMSPKDLCALPFIEQLIEAGITSFKIEGRARSPEYVKAVVSAYKKAVSFYLSNKEDIKKDKQSRALFESYKNELVISLASVYNRGFSNGFYFGKPVSEWCKTYGSQSKQSKEYLGKVINFYPKVGVAEIKLESGDLKIGDDIMIQGVTTGVHEQKVESMQIHGNDIGLARKTSRVGLKLNFKVRMNDKLYLIKKKD